VPSSTTALSVKNTPAASVASSRDGRMKPSELFRSHKTKNQTTSAAQVPVFLASCLKFPPSAIPIHGFLASEFY
jgi:hypothetical protein